MSENDQLQQHLDSAIHGAPQTNPDERRRYLGSLRERVLLSITNAELSQPAIQATFESHLPDFKAYHILLNGKNDAATNYLAAITKYQVEFTLVNNETAQTAPEAIGLLVVAKDAINCETVAISAKYPSAAPTPEKPKKEGLFGRLFD
ncbi:YueI family protein [Latilactobacillus sakei]|uniref:YueI family protein n=1 Tax=Latilactobacillus sakei TaxID=1599 RepID=UPI003F531432